MAKVTPLTDDDILKLRAVVLYVVNMCQVIDYFHLFKILYFADREHYALYGCRIIKDTFCALEKGPVPSSLYDVVKYVTGKSTELQTRLKVISDDIEACDPVYDYMLSAKSLPDMDELSKSDIETLDKSIRENSVLTTGELSEKSHDIAWQAAYSVRRNSEMQPIMMARAGGASEDTIQFILEEESFDAYLIS